jgi:hypothetical protein
MMRRMMDMTKMKRMWWTMAKKKTKPNIRATDRPVADVVVVDEGTVYLVRCVTPAAKDWWDENVEDGFRWGGYYVVEHRYIWPIIEGMEEAGLKVEMGVGKGVMQCGFLG